MMARGIPLKQAAHLMARGFLETVIERLENNLLHKHLEDIFDGKLEQ